jgi:hypothetical protein
VTPEELGRLFESFRYSAFRLECLPSYDVTEDAERESFRLWLAGEPPRGQERGWPELVASAVAAGKSMRRVRMVETPLTEYQRFQCSWGYPANVAAGEVIYILDHRPDGLLEVDFWVFDDETVVVLEYDDSGRFLRPVVADTLEPYLQARDMALKSSVPFREYGARTGMRLEVFMQERLNDPAVMDEVARSALRGRTDK